MCLVLNSRFPYLGLATLRIACVTQIEKSKNYIETKNRDFLTALRNYNRTVFEKMISWTALTMHLGMKTAF